MESDNKFFEAFRDRIAKYYNLSPTLQGLLEEYAVLDVNVDGVGALVQSNQYLESAIMHQITQLGMKIPNPNLRMAISMMGMQRFRDLACSMLLQRLISKKTFELPKPEEESDEQNKKEKEEKKTQPKPEQKGKDGKSKYAEQLKYALKTDEFASVRKLPYSETAFAAGLFYDVIRMAAPVGFKTDKWFEEYTHEIYKHGLKSAMVGVEIAKTLKGFGFAKYVFAGCLIHDIGKVVMFLLYGEKYSKFLDVIAKKPKNRFHRHLLEREWFGITHEYFTSELAYRFLVFREIEKPLYFHHEPYLIRSGNKDAYQFAVLLALASNVASHFYIPKDDKDPVYQTWFSPELQDFRVDRKLLHMVMQRVGRDAY
ncbi:MAG: HDOD domain-containing protein [Bacteriovoracia bacterium]